MAVLIDPAKLPAKAVEAAYEQHSGMGVTVTRRASREQLAAFLCALMEDDEAMVRARAGQVAAQLRGEAGPIELQRAALRAAVQEDS